MGPSPAWEGLLTPRPSLGLGLATGPSPRHISVRWGLVSLEGVCHQHHPVGLSMGMWDSLMESQEPLDPARATGPRDGRHSYRSHQRSFHSHQTALVLPVSTPESSASVRAHRGRAAPVPPASMSRGDAGGPPSHSQRVQGHRPRGRSCPLVLLASGSGAAVAAGAPAQGTQSPHPRPGLTMGEPGPRTGEQAHPPTTANESCGTRGHHSAGEERTQPGTGGTDAGQNSASGPPTSQCFRWQKLGTGSGPGRLGLCPGLMRSGGPASPAAAPDAAPSPPPTPRAP